MTSHRNERPWPDDVLPAQFFATRISTPEQRLMLAVLEDGLTVALEPPPVSRRRYELWAQTDAWLCSDDVGWPFSYVNICQALDIEPLSLRERVLAKRSAALAVRHAA